MILSIYDNSKNIRERNRALDFMTISVMHEVIAKFSTKVAQRGYTYDARNKFLTAYEFLRY